MDQAFLLYIYLNQNILTSNSEILMNQIEPY